MTFRSARTPGDMMNIIDFCIKRPAFTIVLSLLITVIGIISYAKLPVRWIPSITPPVVSIYTSYPGASADLVESQVTTPIEAALAGVDGIDSLSSNSKQGASSITLNFKLGRDINTAVEDVRSALQRITDGLPSGARPPSVEKADPDGEPILFVAFSDTHRSQKEVSDYIKQFILPRLQCVDGVATVVTYGERESAVHIWLDPIKMAALNVTVDEVNRALTDQNIQVPSGQIRTSSRYYNVVTDEKVNSIKEFNDLIIRGNQNQTVRIKDIGQAVVDAANTDSAFRIRGQSAVALGILPQANANPLDVEKNVIKEFQLIKKNVPNGMNAEVVFDSTIFIKNSIHHVYHALFEAIFLVLLVIFFFLGSWRAAFIPIITIPVCMIGTFAFMHVFGFSINTITLMAFVLSIGLVVDDAIVMLENVSRHMDGGMRPLQAAIQGGREMIFPIIAMTITLAAVYAPIAMTSGLLNSIFKEFAITLAMTVLISGFAALTLSPMMCSRLLTKKSETHWLKGPLDSLQNLYQELLETIFSNKKWVLILLVIIGMIGFLFFHFIPSELAPAEDMDEIDAYITAPRDASFAYTDKYVREIEKKYESIPLLSSYLSQAGGWSPYRAYQFLTLPNRQHRKQSAADIANMLSEKTKNIIGVDVRFSAPSSPLTWYSGSDGSSVAMEIMSSSPYKELHGMMKRMKEAAEKYPIFTRVDSRLKWDGEQFNISVDRDKAAAMKIPMQNITSTISTLLAGRTAGHFEYGGNQYDVIVKLNKAILSDPNAVSQFYVRNDNNKMIPLNNLTTMTESTSPEMLPHFERLRSDTLSASLAPGHTIAEAVKVLQRIAKDVLPDNAKYTFKGEAKNYLDSNGKMNVTFLLALIFIYLILVAQFESFIDPLIILLTVPFAMIGALFTLKLFGGTLNIYSDIGLVTLIGLIAKHGILITEFANREREQGKTIEEAVMIAAQLRLRPILMTTAAMILGAIPLALASGSGCETRHQIGWVVTGGLLFGTFFSLIVVPVAYTYLAKFKQSYRFRNEINV